MPKVVVGNPTSSNINITSSVYGNISLNPRQTLQIFADSVLTAKLKACGFSVEIVPDPTLIVTPPVAPVKVSAPIPVVVKETPPVAPVVPTPPATPALAQAVKAPPAPVPPAPVQDIAKESPSMAGALKVDEKLREATMKELSVLKRKDLNASAREAGISDKGSKAEVLSRLVEYKLYSK